MLVFEKAVMRMMVEGHIAEVINHNFVKTFDALNHRFLLAKMKSFSLGDVIVRWIEANISGRISRAHVDGEHSGAFECTIVFRSAP